MANYVKIYVAAERSLEDFVEEIEQILGVPAKRYQKSYIIRYELIEEKTTFAITESFLKNYDGFNFEDYCFRIALLENIEDAEEGKQWRYKRANEVFQAIEVTNKYRLLMTDDDDNRLGEFTPVSQQSPLSEYALKARDLPVLLKLFLMTDMPLDVVANDIGFWLNVVAEAVPNDEREQYVFRTLKTRYRLLQHAIEQSTKPYEKYAYILHIEGRVCRPGERRYWQYESGRELFEQLKQTGRYSLALVGDSGDWFVKDHEYVIEEFVPGKNDV